MNLSSYPAFAMKTESLLPSVEGPGLRLMHAALGIHTETAELEEKLCRYVRGDFFIPDIPMVLEEVGDILWYAALLDDAAETGVFSIVPEVHPSAVNMTREGARLNLDLLLQAASMCSDLVKRHVFYRKPLNDADIRVQLKRILECCGSLTGVLGSTLEAVADRNVAKLKKRHGDKFSAEGAVNRDLDAERRTLVEDPRLLELSAKATEMLEKFQRDGDWTKYDARLEVSVLLEQVAGLSGLKNPAG